jgi:hypothetical protein
VDVEIPLVSRDFVGLLAHELEHVTELVDGVDFRAFAAVRGLSGACRTVGSGLVCDLLRAG